MLSRGLFRVSKWKIGFLVGGLMMVCLGVGFSNNAYAGWPGSFDCYAAAGNILSARDACDRFKGGGEMSCSLWVGASNSSSQTIPITSKTGDVDARIWGMCIWYDGAWLSNWSGNLRFQLNQLSGDNGSVSTLFTWSDGFARGGWGSPTSGGIKINVQKFINGATVDTSTTGYIKYSRNITLRQRLYVPNVYTQTDWSTPRQSDVTLVYQIPTFQGRARVDSGTSIGSSPVSTGYKTDDDEKTKTINCNSASCSASFDFYIKRTAGGGKTQYKIEKKEDSGSWTTAYDWAEGGNSTSGTRVRFLKKSISAGHKLCYRMTWKLHGDSTNKKVTVCADVKDARTRTLTGIPVNENATSLASKTWSGATWKRENVANGGLASIKSGTNSAYTFKGWVKKTSNTNTDKSNINKCATNPNNTNCNGGVGNQILSRTLTANETWYAVYLANPTNTFSGRAEVDAGAQINGNSMASVGYTQDNKKGDDGAKKEIDCGNATECMATFKFWLRKDSGSWPTKYTIQRKVGNGSWTNVSEYINKSTGSPSGNTFVAYWTNYNVPAGSKVCYRMVWLLHNADAERAVDACADATGNTHFEGGVQAFSGYNAEGSLTGKYGTTGWGSTSGNKTVKISDCKSGCNVIFRAMMKKTVGLASVGSEYEVEFQGRKILGTWGASKAVSKSGVVYTANAITLYEGQTACMSLKFHPVVPGSGMATRKLCIYAEPEPELTCGDFANPSSYTSSNDRKGTTSTLSRVKNIRTSSGWKETVYAKPTDNVNWIHCYYPGVQRTANTEVPTNHKENGYESPGSCGIWDSDCSSREHPSYSLTYAPISSVLKSYWSNGFGISSQISNEAGRVSGFTSVNSGDKKFASTGDDTPIAFTEERNNTVSVSHAGSTLYETITTGAPKDVRIENAKHTWSCGWGAKGTREYCSGGSDGHSGTIKSVKQEDGTTVRQCSDGSAPSVGTTYGWTSTCTHDEKNVIYSAPNESASSNAKVIVPYNYDNTVETPEGGEDERKIVYAGELSDPIKFIITTSAKYNEKTDDEYATIVDNAKYKFEVCYKENGGSEKCVETAPRSIGTLNNGGDDESKYEQSDTVSIPDVVAGVEVCVRAAVYPTNSGPSDNINPNYYSINNENSWSYSSMDERVCFIVAKKPSIQIWGGNVFSNGAITTSEAQKMNINGVNTYSPDNRTVSRYFGSWGELGVLSLGSIKKFGSGASMGYAANNSGVLVPQYHFDNSDGDKPYEGPGNTGSSVGGSTLSSFCHKSPLSFANRGAGGVGCLSGNMFGGGTNKIKGDREAVVSHYIDSSAHNGESYYHANDDLDTAEIDGLDSLLGSLGATLVIHAEGDITISNDIMYGLPNKVYVNLEEIPKVIIYAKKDIRISCEVNRIDALIVAEGEVITCEGSDEINAQENSRQLRINGAVITRNLVANRTYGAATGANSIIPAEIIDFDPTLYLLGSSQVGNNDESDEESSMSSASNMNITYFQESAPRY